MKAHIGAGIVKSSKKGRAVKSLMQRVTQAPLYGKEVADRANKHGVRYAANYDGHVLSRKIHDWLFRLAGRDTAVGGASLLEDNYNPNRWSRQFKGVLANMAPANPGTFNLDAGSVHQVQPSNRFLFGKAKPIWRDKLEEAVALEGIEPKAVDIQGFIRDRGLDINNPQDRTSVINHIKATVGDRFIMKPLKSNATIGGSLPTESTTPEKLFELYQRGVRNAEGKILGKGGKWFAQERVDLVPASWPDRAINKLYNKAFGAGSMSGSGKKEYRVHLVDGKVVPYATVFRGGVRGVIPWYGKNHRRAEEAARAIQAKRPDIFTPGKSFSMDLAMGRDKGFHLLEANSSGGQEGLVSGMSQLWQTADSVDSAVRGRLPLYFKAQRALQGTAVGGAGGLGAREAKRYFDKRENQ
jgi:hypothetical protein